AEFADIVGSVSLDTKNAVAGLAALVCAAVPTHAFQIKATLQRRAQAPCCGVRAILTGGGEVARLWTERPDPVAEPQRERHQRPLRKRLTWELARGYREEIGGAPADHAAARLNGSGHDREAI